MYRGSETAPPVTVVVLTMSMIYYDAQPPPRPPPRPFTPEKPETTPPNNSDYAIYMPPRPYFGLIGSTVIQGGWESPADLTLGLVGAGSLFEVAYVQVLVIPYTG